MRVFLAIEIPREVQDSIEEQISEFKKEYPEMTWVSPENFHITLFFFGEVDEYQINSIKKKISDIVFEAPAFRLFSQGADLFLGDKIILYVNFFKEKTLYAINDALQDTFNTNAKKTVVPHMTLARSRVPSKQQYLVIKKKIQNLEIEVEFPVQKLFLIESVFIGSKTEYKKIAEFELIDKTK